MLLRFTVKNLFSFKEETEFNMFPNKSQALTHHKTKCNDIDVLRFGALYGANGSGKSNLVSAIGLLQEMVLNGHLEENVFNSKFRLCSENMNLPISLGIEFYYNKKNYYYTITFDNNKIFHEYLGISLKDKDVMIFERELNDGTQSINFYDEYIKSSEKNKMFIEFIAEKALQKNELLLTFLATKYKDNSFIDVLNSYGWIAFLLTIIHTHTKPKDFPFKLDKDKKLQKFANQILSNFNTGITKIGVDKKEIPEDQLKGRNDEYNNFLDKMKTDPELVFSTPNSITGEEHSLVYEKNKFYSKRIFTTHLDDKGNNIGFPIVFESDGTIRLIDYIPIISEIINSDRTFIIDEIERSIHPLLIKEIVSKLSHDIEAKGQLIFTTHESNLLDQSILRPDEIWFAQKDIEGASKLYSLSEYKIHNTVSIENGYLNGRYGGIPFLSNLKELNWHNHE